jgi:hypothetical protein
MNMAIEKLEIENPANEEQLKKMWYRRKEKDYNKAYYAKNKLK